MGAHYASTTAGFRMSLHTVGAQRHCNFLQPKPGSSQGTTPSPSLPWIQPSTLQRGKLRLERLETCWRPFRDHRGAGYVCVWGCPWLVGVPLPEGKRWGGEGWRGYPGPVCRLCDKPYQTASQVNTDLSPLAALSDLAALRKSWPFPPSGQSPSQVAPH